MNGLLVIAAFLALFMLGFPVVLAIAIPCVVYLLGNGLPLEMIAQRTLYALDSFPLVAVPVFLFVCGNVRIRLGRHRRPGLHRNRCHA